MKVIFQPVLSGALSILMVFMINGCTLIGFGVGTYIDSRSENEETSIRENPDALKAGEHIRVTLKDGSILEGRYSGIEVIGKDEYPERYAEIRLRNSGNIKLPAIGDTITIYLKPERNKVHKNLIFTGFIFHTTEDGRESFIRGKYLQSHFDDQVNLKRICRIIDNHGHETDIDKVREFAASGGMDHITSIVLTNKMGNNKIPLDDIELITLKSQKRMAKFFAAAGLVADVIILFIISPKPESSGSSSADG